MVVPFLLNNAIDEPGHMHEVERFFYTAKEAIKAWGGVPAWEKAPARLGLHVLKRHEAAAKNLIAEHHIPDNFALIAPVARGKHHGKSKSWDHFNALVKPLRDLGVEPIIFPLSGKKISAAKPAPMPRFSHLRHWATIRPLPNVLGLSLRMTQVLAILPPLSEQNKSRWLVLQQLNAPALGVLMLLSLAEKVHGQRWTKSLKIFRRSAENDE